jgi:uncharacterized protein involved in response to NO
VISEDSAGARGGAGAALSPRHAPFRPGFVGVALATAILGGFGLAAHLSVVIGFGFPLGPAFPALVQAHGHAQLVGWAGLFVMGFSLHFIPRLASVSLARPQWVGPTLWLMGTGLLLRTVGQPALAYMGAEAGATGLRWALMLSGMLEGAGIALYLILLMWSLRGTGELRAQPAFAAVRPFLGTMVAGWLTYGAVNVISLTDMALRGRAVVDSAWDLLAIQSFLDLILLPVAMAFSVRLLPMFLALSAAFWPVRSTAYAYLGGVCLPLIALFVAPFALESKALDVLGAAGGVIKGGVILAFTWQLDLLTRRRPVERPARFLQIGPGRPPTRPGLPDFGEFGRFELLVYSAYVWLALAALFEILNGSAILLGAPIFVGEGVVRHIYLLGFITQLICGVSVRTLPGFVSKRAVAFPHLVAPMFWLVNAATVLRVVPLILPSALKDLTPAVGRLAQSGFGLSGAMALAALVLLAINLLGTLRLPATMTPRTP